MERSDKLLKAPAATTMHKGDLVRVAFEDDDIAGTGMHWEYGNITKISQHGELVTIAMENGEEIADAPLFDVSLSTCFAGDGKAACAAERGGFPRLGVEHRGEPAFWLELADDRKIDDAEAAVRLRHARLVTPRRAIASTGLAALPRPWRACAKPRSAIDGEPDGPSSCGVGDASRRAV